MPFPWHSASRPLISLRVPGVPATGPPGAPPFTPRLRPSRAGGDGRRVRYRAAHSSAPAACRWPLRQLRFAPTNVALDFESEAPDAGELVARQHGGLVMITVILVTLTTALLSGCGSSNPPSSAPPTSSAAHPTTTMPSGGAGPSTGSIPGSAAVDALTEDLTGPVAAGLVATCTALVTAFDADGSGDAHTAAVLAALQRLADVVRPVDSAVADALADHPGGAVHWCKVKGFATS